MKERAYNFSAGPSMLPEEVIRDVADNLLNYHECGESVMEMSHRSAEFKAILADAEADLRDITTTKSCSSRAAERSSSLWCR